MDRGADRLTHCSARLFDPEGVAEMIPRSLGDQEIARSAAAGDDVWILGTKEKASEVGAHTLI